MAETIVKEKHPDNKIKEYPILDPQQLLSLIRANQVMIRQLEDEILLLKQ